MRTSKRFSIVELAAKKCDKMSYCKHDENPGGT
jgi:hypothetical protein